MIPSYWSGLSLAVAFETTVAERITAQEEYPSSSAPQSTEGSTVSTPPDGLVPFAHRMSCLGSTPSRSANSSQVTSAASLKRTSPFSEVAGKLAVSFGHETAVYDGGLPHRWTGGEC